MLSHSSYLSHLFPSHVAGSPAILQLRLLEAKFAATRPIGDDARRSAVALIESLRRAIAERPSLSFADVVAKLKTCDELCEDGLSRKFDDLQKALLKSSLADLARIQPES